MNWKKFWLTALIVYIVLAITELIIHRVILGIIQMILCGIATAMVYKPQAATA